VSLTSASVTRLFIGAWSTSTIGSSKREHLVGDSFTLADLTLASVLGHGYAKDKAWSDQYPEAFAYFQSMIKDPKLKGAFGEPTLIDKTPEHKPKEE